MSYSIKILISEKRSLYNVAHALIVKFWPMTYFLFIKIGKWLNFWECCGLKYNFGLFTFETEFLL